MKATSYRTFEYKDSNFRIRSECFAVLTGEIRKLRDTLEAYIESQPEFRTSLVPLEPLPDAPRIARLMSAGAALSGIGPMAAVAGTIAQLAAEAAVKAGAGEAIVENGGDMFLISPREIHVGLYAGKGKIGDSLAFAVPPALMPLAICSSSSNMGHSLSFGNCDLATVISKNAAVADAAATLAGNLVHTPEDIDPVLARLISIPGVTGALLCKGDRVGLIGNLPPLVRNSDKRRRTKITRNQNAEDFPE